MLISRYKLFNFINTAEEIRCHCSVCEDNDEPICTTDRTRGVCTAYYQHNTLIQGCGSTVTLFNCRANNGVLVISDIEGVCCSEEFCNSKQALDDMISGQSITSSTVTPTPTISHTTSSTRQTVIPTSLGTLIRDSNLMESNAVIVHNSVYSICIAMFTVLCIVLM